MKSVGVMQVIDTLETGGAERVAVNIANHLPRERYRSYLCTTRREGPLEAAIDPSVGRLRLARTGRFDVGAIRRFVNFIRSNDIRILHAHGASLFMVAIASRFAPQTRVIWHDHFGRSGTEERPAWLYRMACRRVSGLIAVNDVLADWSRTRLGVPSNRVWYVPNFVETSAHLTSRVQLPGTPGARIVCVANFRPQKDHLTLVRAFKIVADRVPQVHLLLVGPVADAPLTHAIQTEISSLNFDQKVTFLGQRTDVPNVLRSCDIGVLSSNSEGLPLSLLEYGAAGLATVATRVGQCPEVLDDGKAGILVPHSSPSKFAEALIELLLSPDRRAELGTRLHERVLSAYSAPSAIRQICGAYDLALASPVRRTRTESTASNSRALNSQAGPVTHSVSTVTGKTK